MARSNLCRQRAFRSKRGPRSLDIFFLTNIHSTVMVSLDGQDLVKFVDVDTLKRGSMSRTEFDQAAVGCLLERPTLDTNLVDRARHACGFRPRN